MTPTLDRHRQAVSDTDVAPQEDPIAFRAYQAAYRAKNREKARGYAATYRAKNRKKIAAYFSAYYAKNREKIAAQRAAKKKAQDGTAPAR